MEGGKGAAMDDEETNGDGGKDESLGVKLRRGVAVGKKGGLCTPVPTWKVGDSGPADGGAAEPKRSSVSARKLGANLWEIQDLVPAAAMNRKGARNRRHGNVKVLDECPEHLAADHDNRPESAGSLRRHLARSLIKHYKSNGRNHRILKPISPASYSSSMEIAAISQAISPCSVVNLKGKLSEAGYGLRASTELLKVLNRIWSMEEQHASYSSLVKSLKVELEHAQARIQELMREQDVYRREMDGLVKQFAKEKMIRKKEQQKIKAAVQSIRDELEDERHLRKRSESLHRKLGKELSEINAANVKALKDLERQRRTNSLLENLCHEFAKGITDYEKEVRELKQKFPSDSGHKVDRLVLHISEAWLDERVQMNIAEAQGDFAEKTTVTDRLRSEIESFLQTRSSAFKNDSLHQKEEKKESNMRRQSLESVHLNGTTSAPHDADDEDDDDDDSVASEMHCLEVNVSSRKHGSHGQVKQNKQKRIPGEEVAHSEIKENELGRQYKGETEKAKLCGIKTLLPDQVQGVHFGAGDERASEVGHTGTSRTQKSDFCHSQECVQDSKVKWARLRGSKHASKKKSGLSESFPVDHIKHWEESHNRVLWKSQLASIDGDVNSGNMHQVSSPVQQWKYQHSPSNLPESSSKLAHNMKDGTLTEKLLEARLEGKHTRLKTLRRPSMMVRTRHRE